MSPPWVWGRRPLRIPPPTAAVDPKAPPCLIHLVRETNGIGSLREFAAALRAHPPGVECELVMAMKGFDSAAQAAPYISEVADLAPELVFLPDTGIDLGTFFAVATRLRRGRYCFVNSHTRPVVDGWLAKLDAALALPGVGMVGATGSWASGHSWLTYSLGLPSFYRGVLPSRDVAREQLRAINREQTGVEGSSKSVWGNRLRLLPRIPEELMGFAPFPTPHLRNTAIMISHAALGEMQLFKIRNKMDTYALESGLHSFTRQLKRRGSRVLVVDRAGTTYEPCDWHHSRTFCQGAQEGLLAVDNRTLSYERGGLQRRILLAGLAWGECAEPYPSGDS